MLPAIKMHELTAQIVVVIVVVVAGSGVDSCY